MLFVFFSVERPIVFTRRNLLIKKILRITAPVDSKVGMGKKILELSLTEEIDQGMLMFIIRIGSDALIWPFYQAVICLKAGV